MSSIIQLGSEWPQFSGIRNLIIFGDSYSTVGFELGRSPKRKDFPTSDNPLGVSYPGHGWQEAGKPNWVGFLITNYSPPPRYDPTKKDQSKEYKGQESPLLVFDFAVGGDTVAGVQRQIQRQFLAHMVPAPDWAAWRPSDSLFVTWVGINDCARADSQEASVKTLFDLQEQLFEAGARHFLFIDVPPINRSPAIPKKFEEVYESTYSVWNKALQTAMNKFADAHPETTVLLFSAYATFNKVLDDPVAHGFDSGEERKGFGTMWNDHLHPTSKVHDIIARDVASFLDKVGSNTEGTSPQTDIP